ncbi:MAG: zinc ribbon domain-containing protein [Muribaculaceae bacterium]|nr:zinc ribbon domain-containing protein [Roseburia sp.]MCM1432073.1 zinc ribbon domain-containing protein [Muribaculaceae bacterium]MCM1492127.1 zinc ribbon domain-containing protein [Muribaculaceae bacterium]
MICPKCGSEMADGSSFCTKCGAALGQAGTDYTQQQNAQAGTGYTQQQNAQAGTDYTQNPNGQPYGNANGGAYGQPYAIDPKDHTAEFAPKDISDNKVLAMMPYLMGTIGIILALLASKESPYVSFHVRQALKLTVCTVLVGIITAVLCWTVIVPIAGGVCTVILFIVRIISFFQICSGKAKEAAIVSSFGFLR